MSVTTQSATPATVPTSTAFATDVVGAASAPAAGQHIPYSKLDKGAAGASSPITDSNPLPVRAPQDTSRTPWSLFAEAIAGSASEALITATVATVPGSAGASGTSYSVPSGKTLRITHIVVNFIATTTTANTSKIRLRAVASGTALIGSAVFLSLPRLGFETATFIANESSAPLIIALPDGLEFPANAAIAVTHIEAAANGTLDVQLVGFLY